MGKAVNGMYLDSIIMSTTVPQGLILLPVFGNHLQEDHSYDPRPSYTFVISYPDLPIYIFNWIHKLHCVITSVSKVQGHFVFLIHDKRLP